MLGQDRPAGERARVPSEPGVQAGRAAHRDRPGKISGEQQGWPSRHAGAGDDRLSSNCRTTASRAHLCWSWFIGQSRRARCGRSRPPASAACLLSGRHFRARLRRAAVCRSTVIRLRSLRRGRRAQSTPIERRGIQELSAAGAPALRGSRCRLLARSVSASSNRPATGSGRGRRESGGPCDSATRGQT